MADSGPGAGWTVPEQGVHIFPLRVYYEDTDAGGIVHHVNYLKYAERARTDMLRLLGTEQSDMLAELGLAFAVRHCDIDYVAPARLDDVLEVHTRLLEVGGASVRVDQTVKRAGDDLARLTLRIACTRRDGRAARLPAALRSALAPLAQSD